MRTIVRKKNFTKAERRFIEMLKEGHVPFKAHVRISSLEVDFIVNGNMCVDIDGHEQDAHRNEELVRVGYIPLHFRNDEITVERTKEIINKLCH